MQTDMKLIMPPADLYVLINWESIAVVATTGEKDDTTVGMVPRDNARILPVAYWGFHEGDWPLALTDLNKGVKKYFFPIAKLFFFCHGLIPTPTKPADVDWAQITQNTLDRGGKQGGTTITRCMVCPALDRGGKPGGTTISHSRNQFLCIKKRRRSCSNQVNSSLGDNRVNKTPGFNPGLHWATEVGRPPKSAADHQWYGSMESSEPPSWTRDAELSQAEPRNHPDNQQHRRQPG